MDLLFKRYADPFSLLDGYIQTAQFCDFIPAVFEFQHEDDKWDFFLHKVWDKSYSQYLAELHTSQGEQEMSDDEIEATVKKSMMILGNFHPTQEEGEG